MLGLVAVLVVLRMAVPAGYMIAWDGGGIGLTLCSGTAPMPQPAMAGMMVDGAHHGHAMPDRAPSPMGDAVPCPLAAVATPSLAAIDPALLAIVIGFIVTSIGFGGVMPTPPSRRTRFLRPQSRGPPVRA